MPKKCKEKMFGMSMTNILCNRAESSCFTTGRSSDVFANNDGPLPKKAKIDRLQEFCSRSVSQAVSSSKDLRLIQDKNATRSQLALLNTPIAMFVPFGNISV